ncbi:formate dehydrogenase alpha subunit [Dehalogenimonas sp. WBC-2]|nr:formate dehydrogenase alpha subunit [Dehalogenimonas sp. WBC-2]
MHHPERLTRPLIKTYGRFIETDWDEALEYTCSKLVRYQPAEVAVVASANATNEEIYLIQKFARAVLGTNSVDLCSRNNVQGARDMSAPPDFLTRYQQSPDDTIRIKFETAWGVKLPQKAGLTIGGMLDDIEMGIIKALYIVGENIMLSHPDLTRIAKMLAKLQFLVVQDILHTETTAVANVVLTSAGFAEKDDTFTDTELRGQRVHSAVDPAADSRPGWWITNELGKRLGGKGFEYTGPEQIFDEMQALTPGCYTGMTSSILTKDGLLWPYPAEYHPGTAVRLAKINTGASS